MAGIETRVAIGADTASLEAGMAAALATVRTTIQEMRVQFAGLAATARQMQAQIGTAMAQVGAAVKVALGQERLTYEKILTSNQRFDIAGMRAPAETAWRKFASPIESKISGALTDALLGIRQSGGLREVMLGIEKAAVGGIVGNLVKGAGNAFLKPLFGDLAKGMGGTQNPIMQLLATALGLNTTATAANTLATAASSSAATASAGGSLLSAAGSLGGLLGGIPVIGGIAKGIGSFFGLGGSAALSPAITAGGLAFMFKHGGIVPSAAGGWSLPAFAGGMPAILHSREMVLPADLSEGMQNMIRGGGGANGGEVHVHNHFHGPADGASVGRWFGSNKGALAETIRDAWNSGAFAFP